MKCIATKKECKYEDCIFDITEDEYEIYSTLGCPYIEEEDLPEDIGEA